jgi:hypothetical protein
VSQKDKNVTSPFKENIIALCEIRDNAIHFKNDETELGKIVLELGTASLKNYLNAIKHWFDKDLSKYNFYLMPLSFFHEFESISSFSISKHNEQLKKLLNYLAIKASETKSNPNQEYNLLLKVETKFVKSAVEDSLIVKPVRKREDADNPGMVQEVILKPQDITLKFPWTYKDLRDKLKSRYPSFKQDKKFTELVNEIKLDSRFCHIIELYPGNPKTSKSYYYSPNCVQSFFDQYYKVTSS